MSSILLLLTIFLSLFSPSSPQSLCTLQTFPQPKLYSLCNSLPQLSSTLHWTYNPLNSTLSLAFRSPQTPDGWIAWALNPTSAGMDGAQTIFAFHDSRGAMTAVSSPITYNNPTVKNSSLSFKVYSMSSEFMSNIMTIYAVIELPRNRTKVNHVWQASNTFTNGLPSGHALTGPNVRSSAELDFESGLSSVVVSKNSGMRLRRKNIHGVLNSLSWGILMPMGAIIARYMRVFGSADPAWFYLHIACQCSAYIVGVAGWGTGLKLGTESKGITYGCHRNIGITLFCLATLQVFALLLRPNKDHKYRLYWNIYHHAIGYTVIILSIINIFKGFDILDPDQRWKNAYAATITMLGGIAVILEVVTWGIVFQRRRSSGSDKLSRSSNGVVGVNSTNA